MENIKEEYPIRIGASPFLFWLFVSFLIVLLVTGLASFFYAYQWGKYAPAALLLGIVFTPFSIFLLTLMYRSRKTIGMTVHQNFAQIGNLAVPWSDLGAVKLSSVRTDGPKGDLPQVYLCLTLKNPEQFWLSNPKLQTNFARTRKTCVELGLADAHLYINLNGSSQLPDEALRIVQEHL